VRSRKRTSPRPDRAIAASIAADPDEAGTIIDWNSATVELPPPKTVLDMRG